MPYPTIGGSGSGFAVGQPNNIFGTTSGDISSAPLLVTPAASRAAAQTVRDNYATANPSWLTSYNNNPGVGIFIYYVNGSDIISVGQVRIGGQWVDQASTIGIQGTPGSGTDFANITAGHVPAIGPGPDHLPYDSGIQVLPDGSVLAPRTFGVESGSVDFGDLITLSETGGFLGLTNNAVGASYTMIDFATPQNAPSSSPRIFSLIEAENLFVAQPVFGNTIVSDEITFNYTTQLDARTNDVMAKLAAAVTNLRFRVVYAPTGVTLKYWPDKASWLAGTGQSFPAGDVTLSLGDTPMPLTAGTQLTFTIRGTGLQMLGTALGVPYLAAMVQRGVFRNVPPASGVYYFANSSGTLTPDQCEALFNEGLKLTDWTPNAFNQFQITGVDNVVKYVYLAIPSEEVITAINSKPNGVPTAFGDIGVQFVGYATYNGRNYGLYRSTSGTFTGAGTVYDVQFMAQQASAVASANLFWFQGSAVETAATLKSKLGNSRVLSDWNVDATTDVNFTNTAGFPTYVNLAIPVDNTITAVALGPQGGTISTQPLLFLGVFVYQGQEYNAYRTSALVAGTAGNNYTLRLTVSSCPTICAKQVTGSWSARGQTLVYNPANGNVEVSQPVIGGIPVATTAPTNQYLLRYSSFTGTWVPDFERIGGYGNNGVAGTSGQVPVLDTTNGWWAWGSSAGLAGQVMARRKSTAQTVNGDTRISWDTADTNNVSPLSVGLSYDGTTNVGRFTNNSGQGMSLIVSWHGVWALTSQHANTAFATWLRASWSGTAGGQQRYGYVNTVGSPDVTVHSSSTNIWLDDGEWFEVWAWSTSATQSFGNALGGETAGFGASITITRINP